MVPGHTVEGEEAPAGQGGWRDRLQFKFQPCSPVTLGRSQHKAQGEPGGALKWGDPVGLWLCPGLGAAGEERARPGGREGKPGRVDWEAADAQGALGRRRHVG